MTMPLSWSVHKKSSVLKSTIKIIYHNLKKIRFKENSFDLAFVSGMNRKIKVEVKREWWKLKYLVRETPLDTSNCLSGSSNLTEPLPISCSFRRLTQIVRRTFHCMADIRWLRDEASCSRALECLALDPHGNIRMCSWRRGCEVVRSSMSMYSNHCPSVAIPSSDGTIALPTSFRCVQSTSIARRTFLRRSFSRDADCSLRTCTASRAQRRSCCAMWTLGCMDSDQPATPIHRNTPSHREHDLGYQSFDIQVAVEIHVSPSCTTLPSCGHQCIRFEAGRAWSLNRMDVLNDP